MNVPEIIERKREGDANSPEEIAALLSGLLDESVPRYQVSAWLMAVLFRGMTPGETAASADASEQVAEYVTPPGCDTGHLTEETAVGCADVEGGSNSPVTGREDCNKMEDLPSPSDEG